MFGIKKSYYNVKSNDCHQHFSAVTMDGEEYIKSNIYLALNFIFIVLTKRHTLNKHLVHDRLLCYWLCTLHEKSHKWCGGRRRWQRFIALTSTIKRCLRRANMALIEQCHVGPVKGERRRQGTYGSVTSKKGLSTATLSPACWGTPGLPLRLGRRERCLDSGLCLLRPVRETPRDSGDSCPGAITGPLPTKSIAGTIISVLRR